MRTLLEQLRVTYLYYGAHERELDRTRSIPARMKALGWETVCRDEQSECMVFRNINLTTGTAEPSGMRAARPSLHQVDGFGMSE